MIFCTNARDDGLPDIGAVEYDGDGPCVTSVPYVPVVDEPNPDPPDEPITTVEQAPDMDSVAEAAPDSSAGEDVGTPLPDPDVPSVPSAGKKGASGGCQQQPGPNSSGLLLSLLLLGLIRVRNWRTARSHLP